MMKPYKMLKAECSMISVGFILVIWLELCTRVYGSLPVAPVVVNEPPSKPTPTKPPPKPLPIKFLPLVNMKLGASKLRPADSEEQDPVLNMTNIDPDVEIQPQTPEGRWKTKVIIVCTITAATELFFAIFIIVYWKELRWSFRKLTCPCDERGAGEGEHQRMSILHPFSRRSRRHRHRRSQSESESVDMTDAGTALFHQHHTMPSHSRESSEDDQYSMQPGPSSQGVQGTSASAAQEHEVTYAVPSTSRGTSASVVLHHHHYAPPPHTHHSDDDDDDDDDDDATEDMLRNVYVHTTR